MKSTLLMSRSRKRFVTPFFQELITCSNNVWAIEEGQCNSLSLVAIKSRIKSWRVSTGPGLPVAYVATSGSGAPRKTVLTNHPTSSCIRLTARVVPGNPRLLLEKTLFPSNYFCRARFGADKAPTGWRGGLGCGGAGYFSKIYESRDVRLSNQIFPIYPKSRSSHLDCIAI